MKLFYKIYTCLLIGIVLLLTIEGYINYRDEIARFRLDMKNDAILIGGVMSGMISHVWRENGKNKALKLIQDANDRADRITFQWVEMDDPSSVLPGTEFSAQRRALVEKGRMVSPRGKDKNGQMNLYTYVPLTFDHRVSGAIRITQSLAPLNLFRHKMLKRSFIIALLLLIMSGVLLYYLFDRLIQTPLNQLTRKARLIGGGDLNPNLEIAGKDELSHLASSMNAMCEQLSSAQEATRVENEKRIAALEQLRHAERLATLGRLSAGMAHELGTPLNVVAGRAKMIADPDMSRDDIGECAQIIQEQAKRMTAIMQQLLNFARRNKSKRSFEKIEPIVTKVMDMLNPIARKQNVVLKQSLREALPNVYIDTSQIQQVLMNITMNGVQAMPQGGDLELQMDTAKKAAPPHKVGLEKEYLVICVTDEGEGISGEKLGHIFDPFFTTKEVGQGTGLGLSIAYGIIEEHNGWIEVASEPGKGSRFSIYLPTEDSE